MEDRINLIQELAVLNDGDIFEDSSTSAQPQPPPTTS